MTGSEALALALALTQSAPETPSVSMGVGGVALVQTPEAGATEDARDSNAQVSAPPVPEPDWSAPPGGYWRPGEVRAPEPKDGHEKIIAGSILVPLGILGTASGAVTTWMSAPGACEARWSRFGASPDAGQCKGLLILNAIRTTYGALMLGSGLVLLGVGLHQRKQWRRWKERGGVAGWVSGHGAGVELTWRF
jgi:hypothetical protein